MSLREWVLFFLLAAAGGLVVKGVSILTTSGAWVVAGLVVAGLAVLLLTGEDEPTAATEGDET